VQDDWKASNKFTANIGLRWTLDFPSTEKNNQGAVFNLKTQQLQYLGRDGYSTSARDLHFTNFAPRVGFTYLLAPKTVWCAVALALSFSTNPALATPFTTPQFPFIQNVAQKTQDSLNAAFALPPGQRFHHFSHSRCRIGPERLLGPIAQARFRLRAAVEPCRAARDYQQYLG